MNRSLISDARPRRSDAQQLSHRSTWMATREVEVVYYVRIDERTVKIGTSRNLLQRLKQMCRRPDDVLAIEFGGRDLERQRHQAFRHLRQGKTERFRVSADLLAHIREVRSSVA